MEILQTATCRASNSGAIMPANYLQVPSAAVKDDSGKFHCWIGDRHLQFLRVIRSMNSKCSTPKTRAE